MKLGHNSPGHDIDSGGPSSVGRSVLSGRILLPLQSVSWKSNHSVDDGEETFPLVVGKSLEKDCASASIDDP